MPVMSVVMFVLGYVMHVPQMMNVHFWFHALSEIPDIIVWFKNGQHLEVGRSIDR